MVELRGAFMGTPSPRKVFWVVQIKGEYVRFQGVIANLPPGLPTFFESSRVAMKYAQRVVVGELHYDYIVKVTRAWLEQVQMGEVRIKVQNYNAVHFP